jgi:hypothetical protein
VITIAASPVKVCFPFQISDMACSDKAVPYGKSGFRCYISITVCQLVKEQEFVDVCSTTTRVFRVFTATLAF